MADAFLRQPRSRRYSPKFNSLRGIAANAITRLYEVRFAPEIARGLQDGTLHVLQARGGGFYGTAADAGGVFRGNATHFPAHVLQTAAVATLAWQVLAIVTAQKFLADINKQLARIEKGVRDIQAMLEEAQFSRLSGCFRYMRTIFVSLQDGSVNHSQSRALLDQLESAIKDAEELSAFFALREDSARADLQDQKLTGVWLKTYTAAAMEHIEKRERYTLGRLLAYQIKAGAAQLQAALPLEHRIAEHRLAEVAEDVRTVQLEVDSYEAFVNGRVAGLDGTFSRDKTDAEARDRVNARLREATGAMREAASGIASMVTETQQRIAATAVELERPLSVAVEIDEGGTVKRVLALPSAA